VTSATTRKIKALQCPPDGSAAAAQQPPRERILSAAFAVFTERGYGGASTLEIATRARVSKRELYALFGDKRAMLVTCIADRARRMRDPLLLPDPRDRGSFAAVLAAFGATLLHELSQPHVVAVYRLAILEPESPEVAQALDTSGRKATRKALTGLIARAQSAGLLAAADPGAVAEQFMALLCGDLQMRLLLGLSRPPGKQALERRAREAVEALLAIHSPPRQAA